MAANKEPLQTHHRPFLEQGFDFFTQLLDALDYTALVFCILTEHIKEAEEKESQSRLDEKGQRGDHMFGELGGRFYRWKINAPFGDVRGNNGRLIVQQPEEEVDKHQSPEAHSMLVRPFGRKLGIHEWTRKGLIKVVHIEFSYVMPHKLVYTPAELEAILLKGGSHLVIHR